MKNLAYIILIVLNFNSCNAQKNTTMMQEIAIPQITKDSEKFDTLYYNNNKENGEIRKYDNNRLSILLDYSNGYSKAIYNNKSSFHIVKNYYLNGNIEIKGVRFNNGSEYGQWYKFNEEGKLVEELNLDKGYDYGWEEVLSYCNKSDIKLSKGYIGRGGVPTEIYKTELDGKKVWQITYFDKKAEKIFQIVLDGQDGELLNKKEIELVGS